MIRGAPAVGQRIVKVFLVEHNQLIVVKLCLRLLIKKRGIVFPMGRDQKITSGLKYPREFGHPQKLNRFRQMGQHGKSIDKVERVIFEGQRRVRLIDLKSCEWEVPLAPFYLFSINVRSV